MVTSKIAQGLEALKVFTDLIPEPVVKALVNLAVERSIAICTCVERVGENSNAIRDLSEQQAGLAGDVVGELRGLTEVEIKSGRWNDKLSDLSQVLDEVHTFVVTNTADEQSDGGAGKAKTVVKLWHSSQKQAEIKTLNDKLDNIRSRLEMKIAITTSIDVQRVREIVLDMKSSVATSGDVRSITDMVQDLKRTIVTSAEAQRITEVIRGFNAFYEKTLVDRLKPILSGCYGAHGSPKDCLPNTRVTLRQHLRQLLTADNKRRVVWLSGLAGTGKSTVAYSICGELQDTHDVVSFFIKRDDAERSNQLRILHTLVYQLARSLPQVLAAVVGAKDELFTKRLHEQVTNFVIKPLSTALPHTRPVVIVVDAADERDAAVASECDLMLCLVEAISGAVSPARILITSRNRPSDLVRHTYDTVHEAQTLYPTVLKELFMHDKRYDPQEDIRRYFTARFERISTRLASVELGSEVWSPSEQAIDELVRISAGLFIFAATVVRFVDCSTPEWVLNELLRDASTLAQETKPDTIFALYRYIVDHAVDRTDTNASLLRFALNKSQETPTVTKPETPTELDAIYIEGALSILGTQLCLRESVTRDTFSRLWAGHLIADRMKYNAVVRIVDTAISRLSGVLFIWDRDSSMKLLHASFGDFLGRVHATYCGGSKVLHSEVASKCISVMHSTKVAYMDSPQSLSEPRLDRYGGELGWISASDAAARYAFSHWFFHACSASSDRLPHLLKDVRLSERNYWFGGLFSSSTSAAELQEAFINLRDCKDGLEAAYTLAVVSYIYADEIQDFTSNDAQISPRQQGLKLLREAVAKIGSTADQRLSPGGDVEMEWAEPKIEALDQILRQILRFHAADDPNIWFAFQGFSLLIQAVTGFRPAPVHSRMFGLHAAVQSLITELSKGTAADAIKLHPDHPWSSEFWTTFLAFIDDLIRLEKRFENARPGAGGRGFVGRILTPLLQLKENEDFKEAVKGLLKYEDEFRYANRVAAHKIVHRYDAQVISLLATRNLHYPDTQAVESNGPCLPNAQSSTGEAARPSLSEGHSLQGADTGRSEGPCTSEGQPSHVQDPRPPEVLVADVVVKTSTAATLGFFAGLVLLYTILSSFFT